MALLLGGKRMEIALVAAFFIGLIAGLINKGITINIVHKPVDNVDKPKAYNESLAKQLPADVQNYYKQTNGYNQF
jgi:hypothetical protein